MTRCMYGAHHYFRTLDAIAIRQNAIHRQLEIVIRPRRGHGAHGSTGQLFEPGGSGGMVQMSVGTEDPANPTRRLRSKKI